VTFISTIDTGLHRLSQTTVAQAFRHPFAWRYRLPQSALLPVLAIALLGSVISVTAFEIVRRADDARVSAILEFRAQWRARDFESKLAETQTPVAGLAAFVTSQKQIDAEEFRDFTRANHSSDLPGVAMSWLPLVKASERDAFVASARQTVATNFDIFESTSHDSVTVEPPRDEYLPVLFRESFNNSISIPGLDVWALPGRRALLDRARDEGHPVAMFPIRLFADSKEKENLQSVLYWPI